MAVLSQRRIIVSLVALTLFLFFLHITGISSFPFYSPYPPTCRWVHSNQPREPLPSSIQAQINPHQDIALLSWVYGGNYQRPGNISALSKLLYCARFNYSCYDFRTLPTAQRRDNFETPHYNPDDVQSCVWAKIQWIHQILGDHEWIWWSDADTVLRTYQYDLEGVIEIACAGKRHCDMLATKDFNGFNAGSFLLRRSPWTFQMLEHVLRQYDGPKKIFNEQSYMTDFFEATKDELEPHVVFIDQELINAYSGQSYENPKSLLLHFPGTYMQHGRGAVDRRVETSMESIVKETSKDLVLTQKLNYLEYFKMYQLELLYPANP